MTWNFVARAIAVVAVAIAGLSAGRIHAAASAPSIRSLNEIQMLGREHGFGLFEVPGAGSQCSAWVGETMNGGSTFADFVHVQTWNCSTSAADRLAADDAGDLFVYGNGLFESHDAGKSWRRTAIPGEVEQVAAIGRSIWLASEMCRSSLLQACPVGIEASPDGGRTWRRLPSPRPASALTGVETRTTTILVRENDLIGYLFSGPPTQLRPFHHLAMWSTSTGGRSWVKHVLPCAEGPFWGVYATVSPSGELIVVCAGSQTGDTQRKSLSLSTNRGRTWMVLPTYSVASVISNGYVGSIAAPSSSDVFEAGELGSVNVTHDAGASWKSVLGLGAPGGGPEEVTFVNSDDGFVLGDSARTFRVTIWRTSDSGRSWGVTFPRCV
jgi:hypothetical protein